MDDERLEGDGRAGQDWWRHAVGSPRLLAAGACFVLGAVVLALSLGERLGVATPPVPAEMAFALDEPAQEDAAADDAPVELVVYITGAVVAPDVYRLPAGARVKDAVLAAGGLRPDAAAERVNLAEPLIDAQHIHVPALADAAGASQPEQAAEAGKIDLNRAAANDLEELPGVGTVLAERIVAYRAEQGSFGSVEELREVPGIGPRLYEQIAPLVTVGR